MSQAVADYQTAIRTHAEKTRAVGRHIELMSQIKRGFESDARSMMGWLGYSHMPGPQQRYDESYRVNLAAWPDRDQLLNDLKDWAEAFVDMKRKYDALPSDDQVGLKAPPANASTTRW